MATLKTHHVEGLKHVEFEEALNIMRSGAVEVWREGYKSSGAFLDTRALLRFKDIKILATSFLVASDEDKQKCVRDQKSIALARASHIEGKIDDLRTVAVRQENSGRVDGEERISPTQGISYNVVAAIAEWVMVINSGACTIQSRVGSVVPLKSFCVKRLMYVKPVEAQNPPVVLQGKFQMSSGYVTQKSVAELIFPL
ncbi:hypothetical protein TNCV_333081 [Trichonephila clavipes]|nr:hypothetical protein TNCV_333081 [Trichonephila clavipes]